jgi:hypothetical protein
LVLGTAQIGGSFPPNLSHNLSNGASHARAFNEQGPKSQGSFAKNFVNSRQLAQCRYLPGTHHTEEGVDAICDLQIYAVFGYTFHGSPKQATRLLCKTFSHIGFRGDQFA